VSAPGRPKREAPLGGRAPRAPRGPTWVLLRGLARERRHWGGFPDLLRHALPGGEVLTLDLPGNGALYRLPSPARIEAMAGWVHEELARRGAAPPYQVLGLSLGAMVAVAWAHARPHDVTGLVLINTSLRPYNRVTQRLRPSALRFVTTLAGGGDAEVYERAILGLTSNRPEVAAALLPDWAAWRRECPVSGANALRQLWAAARYRAPLAPPPPPLLLLASRRDRLVNPVCSRTLAQRWHRPLVEHPDAGHDLPLDDGAWVAEEVRAWLARPGHGVGIMGGPSPAEPPCPVLP